MVLIAGSIGFVVYLRFGLTGAESFLIGLGVLTALAVYNAVAARSRDRAEVSDQIASISRSSADLARQLAEFGRQLGTVETKVDSVLDKALASAQPLAVEIEEMSTLVKHLADSVAAHEAVLAGLSGKQRIAPAAPAVAANNATAAVPMPDPAAVSWPAVPGLRRRCAPRNDGLCVSLPRHCGGADAIAVELLVVMHGDRHPQQPPDDPRDAADQGEACVAAGHVAAP